MNTKELALKHGVLVYDEYMFTVSRLEALLAEYSKSFQEKLTDGLGWNDAALKLHKILIKISDFCPPDNTVDLLDESPENSMRLTIAEVGDTARAGLNMLAKSADT